MFLLLIGWIILIGLVRWVVLDGINNGDVVYVFGIVLYEDRGCLFVWDGDLEFKRNEC